jgi:hypothetical protein
MFKKMVLLAGQARIYILAFTMVGLVATSLFAVPQYMSYSARLTQNGRLANGNKTMTFKIYDAQAPGGTVLFSQSGTVTVFNGIYSVDVGPMNADVFSNGNPVYIETTVGNETLLPRTKINSNLFAMQAGGLTAPNGITINAGSGSVMTPISHPSGTKQDLFQGWHFLSVNPVNPSQYQTRFDWLNTPFLKA